MASLLPSSGSDDLSGAAVAAAVRDFSFLEEAAKSLISLVEVWGVQLILAHTPNLAKFSAGTRILAIALGMSFAESMLRYAIPIFWGARAAEFSWSFLEMSVSSNLNLGWSIVFVTAVWLRTRTDLSPAALPGVWTILAANAVLPSVDHYLLSSSAGRSDSWNVLGLHVALIVVLGMLAKQLFNSYMAQRAAQAAGSSKAQ